MGREWGRWVEGGTGRRAETRGTVSVGGVTFGVPVRFGLVVAPDYLPLSLDPLSFQTPRCPLPGTWEKRRSQKSFYIYVYRYRRRGTGGTEPWAGEWGSSTVPQRKV